MDGTIVDNMNVHMRAWIDLLTGLGIHVTPEDYRRRAMGRTNRRILRELVGDHLTEDEITSYAERKESIYRARYGPYLRPVDGLVEFLEQCRRLEIPLALATSAPAENVEFVLGRLGIAPRFRAIVGAEEVARGKPDPEMFLEAARRLGVVSQGCLVFEDSPFGIEAARRAGMKSVAIATSIDPGDFPRGKGLIRVVTNFEALDPAALLAEMPGP